MNPKSDPLKVSGDCRFPIDSGKNLPTPYLLSIDLEDIQRQADATREGTARVHDMMRRYLSFFDDYGVKSTVFVVGELAGIMGGLIKEIHDAGHEIGCHTHDHTHVAKMNPEKFRTNMLKNLEALNTLGIEDIRGFRAPDYSLTKSARWAHDVLADLGFSYSSSVMPAWNPIFSWKEFPPCPVKLDNGLWELPISVGRMAGIRIPFCGGVYWRFFPSSWIGFFSKRQARQGLPLTGYFHPYDIDSEEKKFQVSRNPFFNWLVFFNRNSTLPKMAWIFRHFQVSRYIDYIHILDKTFAQTGHPGRPESISPPRLTKMHFFTILTRLRKNKAALARSFRSGMTTP